MKKQMILEIAVYQSTQTESVQAEAHQLLKKYQGFQDSLALRSHDKSLWADLVLWTTAEAAQAAAASVSSEKGFVQFLTSITDLIVFAHYNGFDLPSFQRLSSSPVVELAAYDTKSDEDVEVRRKIHDALIQSQLPTVGIATNRLLESTDASAPNAVDVIGWCSTEDHGKGPVAVIKQYPELASSLESFAMRMKVFSTFCKSI
jgi:hypothetical protein